ncbi:MAG: SPOR domain-containing protein [Pseudomonadota bacterium]
MLRLLALLLVLGNAGYFAWTRGLLVAYGFAPASQTEPQRLAQQIHPEAMRLLIPPEIRPAGGAAAAAPSSSSPAPAASSAVAPASAAMQVSASNTAPECLQVGLFNEEQTVVLRARLQSVLPAGSWVLESGAEPPRWIVYMGKYSGADAVAKKKGELRQLHVSFEPLNNPALEPGLSLGSFGSQPEADAEMARIAKRGVRTAKVIQAAPESRGQKLRLPAVDAGLRPQLEALKPQLAGKILQACH